VVSSNIGDYLCPELLVDKEKLCFYCGGTKILATKCLAKDLGIAGV
jgi:hypothetical protein